MTVKGHIMLTGVLVYLPVKHFVVLNLYTQAFIILTLSLLGSILPDIDEPKSYIGRKATSIALLLNALSIKHRTLTHWLITPFFIFALALFFDGVVSLSLSALAFGILTHDIGDLITKGGIRGFFFPFFRDKKIAILPQFLRIETFSFTEMMIVQALTVVNIYLYYTLLTVSNA